MKTRVILFVIAWACAIALCLGVPLIIDSTALSLAGKWGAGAALAVTFYPAGMVAIIKAVEVKS